MGCFEFGDAVGSAVADFEPSLILRADYPMLERAIGESSFASLAATYFQVLRDRSEVFVGERLPELLVDLSVRPDVIDLAELERARALVLREPLEALWSMKSPAKTWPAARRVRMIRAWRLLELSCDAMTVHWQLEEGLAPLPPRGERVFALVWRSPRAVEHTRLGAQEAAIVSRAGEGASVGSLDMIGGRALARRVLAALVEGSLLAEKKEK
jgi:hypothetical protein